MATTGTPRRRISAAQRREQLIDGALLLARREGAGAVTLARVAEEGGVTKPIAYQHFGTVSGLLEAMYERVTATYEGTMINQLAADAEAGANRRELLHSLCETYIACNLDNGVLHDDIAAALLSNADAGRAARVEVAEVYVDMVRARFGVAGDPVHGLVLMFLGAADRLCDGVLTGAFTRAEAIEQLEGLFAPVLDSAPRVDGEDDARPLASLDA